MKNLTEKNNSGDVIRDHASEYEIICAQKGSKKNYPLSNSKYIYIGLREVQITMVYLQ